MIYGGVYTKKDLKGVKNVFNDMRICADALH